MKSVSFTILCFVIIYLMLTVVGALVGIADGDEIVVRGYMLITFVSSIGTTYILNLIFFKNADNQINLWGVIFIGVIIGNILRLPAVEFSLMYLFLIIVSIMLFVETIYNELKGGRRHVKSTYR